MPTVGEAFQQARDLAAAGQLAEAEAIHRKLTSLLPEAAEVWGELGVFYLNANRPDVAVDPLVKATGRDPRNGAYHSALGAAYRLLKRGGEAAASFGRALAIGPPTPELYNNLALAQKDAGQYDDALGNFDAALAMRSDYQTGHFNRGNLLLAVGRLPDALASLERAVALDPNDAGAQCSLGLAHFESAQHDEATAAFDRALAIRADYPEARRNQALVWFLRGEYAKAWPAFESRLACDDFGRRDFDQPRWDGSPLDGRTLYVYWEQGLGDALQFVRYLPLAAKTAGRVWYEPHEPLRPLLVQSGFGEYLVAPEVRPAADVCASLLSLAGFLPDASGTPFWPGPYLSADARLVAQWKARLQDVPGFRVGIAWSGNPDHPHDRFRSTKLAHFAPLGAVPGVRLISLQRGVGSEQVAEVAGQMNVVELDGLDETSGAFVDSAAVIESLDLVISIDTSIAHLAGALGKPVWMALQHVPDWRWLSRGAATPWYPSMRLFRQQTPGDWQAVFAEMAGQLQSLATARG